MSKFIGTDSDVYGNVSYIIGFNENSVKFSTNVMDAILISADDKKIINKAYKKMYKRNPKYIKLEKFDGIWETTNRHLADYETDFMTKSPSKFLRHEDDMSLECISFAKTTLNGVDTFDKFGEIVAKTLVEKYSLKKKGNN